MNSPAAVLAILTAAPRRRANAHKVRRAQARSLILKKRLDKSRLKTVTRLEVPRQTPQNTPQHMAGKVGNTRPDQETAQNPVKIVPPLRFVPPPVARRQRQKTPRRPKDHARSQRDSAAGKHRHADAISVFHTRRACRNLKPPKAGPELPPQALSASPEATGAPPAAVEGQLLPSAPPEPSGNRQTAPPVPESSHRRRPNAWRLPNRSRARIAATRGSAARGLDL